MPSKLLKNVIIFFFSKPSFRIMTTCFTEISAVLLVKIVTRMFQLVSITFLVFFTCYIKVLFWLLWHHLWHSVSIGGLLETCFGQVILIFEGFGWSSAPIDNFQKHRWILNALAYNALGVCLHTYLWLFWSHEIFGEIAYKFIRQFFRNKSQYLFERPPPGENLHLNPLKEMRYSFSNILQ